MKNETSHSRLDITGSGPCSSDREIFNSVLKRWRQRLGYFSIFATVPALAVSQVHAVRNHEATQPSTGVTGRKPTLPERLNTKDTNRGFLKRQSQFRLTHQKVRSDLLAPLAGGLDDCPGRAIPGGNYTAATPYIDSGNTTGANNTVSSFPGYYYNYGASGPDHLYSFTLMALGTNPQIEVSTTSGTYKPLIHVLRGDWVSCPAGTGNAVSHSWSANDSRWYKDTNTVTLDLRGYPLNVPFTLFVDSQLNDANGAGPYTFKMRDVTIAPGLAPNQIDDTQFFVRQHYRDFLSREADPEGLAFWTNEIDSCGGDQKCVEVKRITDSGSFFLSIEFQETGYLVYRFYKTSYGNLPGTPVPIRLSEFLPDTQKIAEHVIVKQSGWEQKLESNKLAFATEFVQRARFVSTYPTSMSSEQFVDALYANSEVTPSASDRNAAINEFTFAATTNDVAARARVLRRVAEHPTMVRQEFPRAFVLMQYFGYLRRNPNDAPDGNFDGHNFWLDKLHSFNGDFMQAEMVKAFISSAEYRRRFGQ